MLKGSKTKVIQKLLLVFLTTLSLNAIEINKNKTFTIQSEEKNLKTSFRINMQLKSENRIESTFKRAIKLSNRSDICTGGSYTVSPHYKYENSKRIKDGYRGNISFDCTFQDKENYEKLIDKIKKLKNIQLSQNRINIVAVDKSKELEQISFEYASNYIHELHNYFVNCKVELINVLSYHQPASRPYYLRANKSIQEESDTTVTSPIKKGLTQSLNVEYKFNCQRRK